MDLMDFKIKRWAFKVRTEGMFWKNEAVRKNKYLDVGNFILLQHNTPNYWYLEQKIKSGENKTIIYYIHVHYTTALSYNMWEKELIVSKLNNLH